MAEYGYFLSTEEFGPADLVEQARMAEQAGFQSLWISDHYHPWNDAQGQSPFVWSVIGALSEAVSLPIGTAVTCPTVRTHPAVVAQAAATSAVMTNGRFRLGVGSGEALNEHIVGAPWPPTHVRLDMLEEAIQVMRHLFTGDEIRLVELVRLEAQQIDALRGGLLARATIRQRLTRGRHRQVDAAVGALRILGIHVFLGDQIAHFGADAGRIGGRVEAGNRSHSALARHDAGPRLRGGMSQPGDGADPGDNNSSRMGLASHIETRPRSRRAG